MENRLGVVSCHLGFGELPEAFEKARHLGIDTIEWFEWGPPEVSEPGPAAQIVELSRLFGVAASYHAPYVGDADLGRLAPQPAKLRLADMLARARRLGAHLMTLHLGTHEPSASREEALDKAIGAIAANAGLAEHLNVGICVENFNLCYGETALGVGAADFDRLFDAVEAPWVGMNLDVGHANLTGDLFQLIERFGHRLYSTHLHDTDGTRDGHLPPGQGTVAWDALFSLLAAMPYEGPFHLEFPASSGAYPAFMARIRAFGRDPT